jgi:DnaJ-class molecular chaperone
MRERKKCKNCKGGKVSYPNGKKVDCYYCRGKGYRTRFPGRDKK